MSDVPTQQQQDEAWAAYEAMQRASNVGEHTNITIAVLDPKDDYGFMVNPDQELKDWIDGYCLADCRTDNFPQEVGVYVCTIERHFEQGYSEGYPADGESDYWLVLKDVRKVDVSPYIAPTD